MVAMSNEHFKSKEAYETHHQLANNLVYYSNRILRVISKNSTLENLSFNEAQMILHAAAEHMKAETGWVRIIVIKGRQQGMSTYIAARYYHLAQTVPFTRVSILSHNAKSAKDLYGKIVRFDEHAPSQIKSITDVENRQEREYKNDSSYTVGTANNGEGGRGDTSGLHHYSEFAFYEHIELIKAGLGQTLPDLPGTEAFWESTANGYNFAKFDVDQAVAKQGLYTVEHYRDPHTNEKKYKVVYKRNSDEGQYRVVFVPWYVTKEYRLPVPKSFRITDEEQELKDMYDLDDEQIVWRRAKIDYFKSETKFKQEYPFTLAEAFQRSGSSFFDAMSVRRAMTSGVKASVGANILGVDGSEGGEQADRACIVKRRGIQVIWKKVFYGCSQIQLAAHVAKILEDPLEEIDKCFIDRAYGDAVVEILRGRGFGQDIVESINFNGTATDDKYLNKRAEMYGTCREWLNSEDQVGLPNDPDLETEFMMIPEQMETIAGRLQITPKRKIKEDNGGLSPDILDALVLTFAYPVRSKHRDDDFVNWKAERAKGRQNAVKQTPTSRERAKRVADRLRGGTRWR